MKKAVFIMMPTIGHVNSVLKLAKILRGRAYDIVFAGFFDHYLRQYILVQGYQVVDVLSVPFGLNFSDELNFYYQAGKTKADLIRDRLLNYSGLERTAEIGEFITKHKPDLILLDSFLGNDYLCWYPYLQHRTTKFVFVTTMGPVADVLMPPANSYLRPEQSFLINMAWLNRKLTTGVNHALEYVYTFGHSQNSLIRKKLRAISGLTSLPRNSNLPLGVTWGKHYELVTSYMEFDHLKSSSGAHRCYLGLQVDHERREMVVDKNKENLEELMKKDHPFIYISFGTLYRESKFLKSLFFQLMQVARLMPGYGFIFSNLSENLLVSYSDLPPNVNVFGKVPQQMLLSKAKLFISHGGLNSIKEAIFFGVPMLVIPLNTRYDQIGNAAKVKYHGLGSFLRPSKCSSRKIVTELLKILNENGIKESMHKERLRIKERYTSERVNKIIDEIIQ